MSKVINEIKHDLNFIRTHSLQPQWYKVFKVFMILASIIGYYFVFGVLKTITFFTLFFILSFIVHMVYRVKTNSFTRSWLDFVVVEEENQIRAESIGRYYYIAIILNIVISLLVSQVLI
jgi:hypothetical protein